MTLRDFATLIWRHRLVALVVIILGSLAGAFLLNERTLYQNTTVIQLRVPWSREDVDPYEVFTYQMLFAAQTVQLVLESPTGEAKVRAAGGTADYTAKQSNAGNEEQPFYDRPYIILKVYSHDPVEAATTRDAVMKVMRADLAKRQMEVGSTYQSLIAVRILDETGSLPVQNRRMRSLAAVAVLGLLVMLTAVFLMERHPLRRLRLRGGPHPA